MPLKATGVPHRSAVWREPPPVQQVRQRADPGAVQGEATAPQAGGQLPLQQQAPFGQSQQRAADLPWAGHIPPVPPLPPTTPLHAAQTPRREQVIMSPHEAAGFAPPVPPMTGDPEWLAEHLQREAALHREPHWNSLWRRRLVTWGLAGVLLAAAGAGALWLVEESRVEGALGVVANTSPTPEPPPARRVPPPAANPAGVVPGEPAGALPNAVTPLPPAVTVESAAAPAASLGQGEEAVGNLEEEADVTVPAPKTAAVRPSRRAIETDRSAQPKRERVHARNTARNTAGDAEARRRREETRLQCEAHGYDAAQCQRRRCEMTPYGLACKG